MKYFGLGVTHKYIRPTNKKLEAIKNMTPLTTKNVVHKFIGLVKY